jgi:tetratricopeptide (TPR) repeat protein
VNSPLSFSSPLGARRSLIVALLSGLFVAGPLFAQEKQKEPPQLSEKATQLFTAITPLQKEQNWKGIIDLINAAIPQLAPNSYDLAEVLSSKGIAFLQIEDYPRAIEPLETSLRLSDTHEFFERGKTLQIIDLLARLYSSEASAAKDPAVQKQYFAKAGTYFKRWFASVPKPNPDMMVSYASILVNQASADPNNIDLKLIKEAREITEKTLLATLKPKESSFQLLSYTYQQEGNYDKMAEVLELLVKQYPTKSVNYWQQLMATYNSLAGASEKHPAKMRQYFVRAINTIERAQVYGFLKTPKDQYNLVTLYSLAGQFGRSTELLSTGLQQGTIESDIKNWFLLAYAYQQVNQELNAINALREAARRFPKAGQIDFQIGQLYSLKDDTKAAHVAYRSAHAKGGGDKPFATAMFLAYTSFELGLLDEAMEAITKAEKMPEGPADKSLPKMKEAIQAAIDERDEKEKKKKEAAEAAAAPKTL